MDPGFLGVQSPNRVLWSVSQLWLPVGQATRIIRGQRMPWSGKMGSPTITPQFFCLICEMKGFFSNSSAAALRLLGVDIVRTST